MTKKGKKPAGGLLRPKHPERICWGCDRYCPADDLGCANGTIRTPHPAELFGDDWLDEESEPAAAAAPEPASARPAAPEA